MLFGGASKIQERKSSTIPLCEIPPGRRGFVIANHKPATPFSFLLRTGMSVIFNRR